MMDADSTAHGPGHLGCPTCDPGGGELEPARPRTSTVRVPARGTEFRIVQVQGNLFVCTKQTGSCCCGWEEKGRMPFETRLWSDEWERRRIRNRLHLTLTGCLGPCAVGNNTMLQLHGRSIWFKDLNDPALVPAVFDYAQAMLDAGRVLPPPPALVDHVYERYLPPPPQGGYAPLVATAAHGEGLERLDPVCLMDVDPVTARHTVGWGGRTIYFCAAACKEQFLADPEAYAIA